ARRMRHPVSTFFVFSGGVEEKSVTMAGGIVLDTILPATPQDAGPSTSEDADGVWMTAATSSSAAVDLGSPKRAVARVVGEAGQSAAQSFVAGVAEGNAAVFAGGEGHRSDAGFGGEMLVGGKAGSV